jgi:hypothetical protein
MIGRALRDFLRDLAAGDPVALGLVGAFVLFLLVLGIAGFFIVRQKKRRDEEYREKRKKKYGK